MKFKINTKKSFQNLTWLSTKDWIRTTLFAVLSSTIVVLLILIMDAVFLKLREKFLL